MLGSTASILLDYDWCSSWTPVNELNWPFMCFVEAGNAIADSEVLTTTCRVGMKSVTGNQRSEAVFMRFWARAEAGPFKSA